MAFLLIIAALVSGVLLQKLPLPHKQYAHKLNQYVLWVALPALTFRYLSGLHFEWQYVWIASVAWMVFLGAWLWVILLQRTLRLPRDVVGCLLLTCGLGNTSFVGFPLISWLFGPETLDTALIIDQVGSFLILSTLGLIGGSFYVGQHPKPTAMLKRILTFPPFGCFVLAMLLNSLNWTWSPSWMAVWSALGSTLTPAALLAVGLQLHTGAFDELKHPLTMGLLYKLTISPLLIFIGYRWVLQGDTFGVAVLEAAMAPMITGSIVASNLGLKPELASLMVSVGIPLSLITVPLWYYLAL